MFRLQCLLNTLGARKTDRAEIGMGRPMSAEHKFIKCHMDDEGTDGKEFQNSQYQTRHGRIHLESQDSEGRDWKSATK